MKVNKTWNIEMNEKDWEVIDFWCTACRENKELDCKICLFKPNCRSIIEELNLDVE